MLTIEAQEMDLQMPASVSIAGRECSMMLAAGPPTKSSRVRALQPAFGPSARSSRPVQMRVERHSEAWRTSIRAD